MKVLLFLAALVALAVPAGAEGTCYTTSVTDSEHLVLEAPDPTGFFGTQYVVNDLCQDDEPSEGNGDPYGGSGGGPCLFSIWFYTESNGIPGLQRMDEVVNDVARCTDGTSGDILTFY